MNSISFLVNRWLAPAILATIYLIANFNSPFRELLGWIPACLEMKIGKEVFTKGFFPPLLLHLCLCHQSFLTYLDHPRFWSSEPFLAT